MMVKRDELLSINGITGAPVAVGGKLVDVQKKYRRCPHEGR
jgi:hypothetical protein